MGNKEYRNKTATAEDVNKIVSRKCNIPIFQLNKYNNDINIKERKLKSKIIGQEDIERILNLILK